MNLALFGANDYALLDRAIDAANAWKGALHPSDYDEHDKEIAAMHRALERASNMRDVVKELKKSNKRLQRRLEKLL